MGRQIQGESHSHRQAQAPQPPSQPEYQAQPRSQDTTAAAAAPAPPPPVTTTATRTQAGPMDISANPHRQLPEERARRMAEGRCYRCGGIGHIVRQCHLGQPPTMRAAAAITTEALPQRLARSPNHSRVFSSRTTARSLCCAVRYISFVSDIFCVMYFSVVSTVPDPLGGIIGWKS